VVGAGDVERHDLLPCRGLGGGDGGLDFGLSPETMIWPGALKLAASMSNSRQSSATLARVLAHDGGHAAEALLAGHLHQPAALGHHAQTGGKIEHARGVSAVISPRLRPRRTSPRAAFPCSCKAASSARPCTNSAGWQTLVCVRSASGPSKQTLVSPAEHAIGLVEERARRRRLVVQRLAHAHLLGALTGK
jgi:hypothetical protein